MSENEVQPVTEDLDAFTNEFFGQNPAPEPEPPTSGVSSEEGEEEETPPVAEQGDVKVEPDSQEEDPDSEVEDEEPVAEAPKAKPTVQDRINELVRQREEAKREGDQKLEALRREFEEKLANLAPKPPEKVEAGEPSPDDLKEDGTPKYDLGEFDPAYIRDLTKYTLNAERQQAEARAQEEARQNQERQAQEALITTWNEKVTAATTEYPDFMEKGQALLGNFDNLDSGYAQYLSTVLMSMDKGPDVLYYLSNNPAEAATIVNSGAQKATLALGRIEAKFLEADANKVLQKPKVSKAPTPPPPSTRNRGSNGAFVSVAPDTDDLDAFTQEFFKKK